eukprot:scaffold9792_cov121-Isochrysis_galbana.AAC.2
MALMVVSSHISCVQPSMLRMLHAAMFCHLLLCERAHSDEQRSQRYHARASALALVKHAPPTPLSVFRTLDACILYSALIN